MPRQDGIRLRRTEARIFFIPITLADKDGNVESHEDKTLTVTVEGGELLGFGSANPRTGESFTSGTYTTYYGHAAAVLRVTDGTPVTITVSSGDATGARTIAVDPQ